LREEEFSKVHLDNKIYFVIGKSGSGKSTFLKLLSRNLARELHVFLPQNYSAILLDTLQIKDLLSDKDNKFIDKFTNMLDLLNLGNITLDSYFWSFSTGQKQRIFLAYTLSFDVKYYLLDEPTANLDSKSSETFFNYIKNTAMRLHNRGYIIVTHEIYILPIFINYQNVEVIFIDNFDKTKERGKIKIYSIAQFLQDSPLARCLKYY